MKPHLIKHKIVSALRSILAITKEESKEFVEEHKGEKITQEDLQNFVDKKKLDAAEIGELMYDMENLGIVNLSKPTPYVKPASWDELAVEELVLELELDLDGVEWDDNGEYVRVESQSAGNNGESEWMLFEDEDDAESYAVGEVTEDLKDTPENFNSDFLKQHYYVTDTDKRLLAQEDADSYTDDLDDDDAIDTAENQYNFTTTDADEARKHINDKYYDQRYDDLDQDPLGYADDLGYDNYSKIAWLTIDYKKASEEAVSIDGIAHFLDNYDGAEVNLPSGAVAYGTN